MFSRDIIFEWFEGEDEYDNVLKNFDAVLFAPLTALSLTTSEFKALFYLGRALVPVLALVLTAPHAVPPGFTENLIALNGVTQSLLLEQRARATDDAQLYASLLEERTDSSLSNELMQLWLNTSAAERRRVHLQLIDVKMNGGLALAKMQIAQTVDDGPPLQYLQYRFYRQVDGQWLRTFPSKSYWGEYQSLRTDYLRFEFRTRDADVVQAAAPQLDKTYADLYTAVGMLPPAVPLTIRVVERDRPGWTVNQDRLNVPSYMVTVADPSMNDVEAFSQSIISNMVFQVLRESQTAQGGNRFVLWSALFPGLHSWLTKEQSGYALMWEPRMAAALQLQLRAQGALTLNDVSFGSGSGRNPWQWRTLALESIVDYVATRYGRERLPEFIRALSLYHSWGTLIPDLYDVSAAEFEADWNAHLAQHYR
ncbi:MAG: hypothetical protein R2911_22510 [Caldilineaceae bacterium]